MEPNEHKSSKFLASAFKVLTINNKSSKRPKVYVRHTRENEYSMVTADNLRKEIANVKVSPTRRAEAATALCKLIRQNAVTEYADVWIAGLDMLNEPYSTVVKTSMFNLMHACIEYFPDMTALARLTLFFAIADHLSRNDICHILALLRSLTKDGRNLEPFEQYTSKLLTKLLVLSFDFSTNLSTETENLFENYKDTKSMKILLRLIINTVKFSFFKLIDKDFKELMLQIIRICHLTELKPVLSDFLELIDVTIIYGHVPTSSVVHVVELLTSALVTMTDAPYTPIVVMRHLLTSHSRNSVIQSVINILRAPDQFNVTALQGCLIILPEILQSSKISPSIGLGSLALLFDTLMRSIDIKGDILKYDIFNVVNGILDDKDMLDTFTFQDWKLFLDCVYSSVQSIYDPIPSKSISGEHVKKSPIGSNLVEQLQLLCGKLQDLPLLYSFYASYFEKRVVQIFVHLVPILPENYAQFVLGYYYRELLCNSNQDEWVNTLGAAIQMLRQDSTNELFEYILHLVITTCSIADRDHLHDLEINVLVPFLKLAVQRSDVIFAIQLIRNFITLVSIKTCQVLLNIVFDALQENVSQYSGNDSVYYDDKETPVLVNLYCDCVMELLSEVLKQDDIDRVALTLQEILRFIETNNFKVFEIQSKLLIGLTNLRCDIDMRLYLPYNPGSGDASNAISQENTVVSAEISCYLTKRDGSDRLIIKQNEIGIPFTSKALCHESLPKLMQAYCVFDVVIYARLLAKVFRTEMTLKTWSALLIGLRMQLQNKKLFSSSYFAINQIRMVLCDLLLNDYKIFIDKPTKYAKAELIGQIVDTIPLIAAYHKAFHKVEEDELVLSVHTILHKWQQLCQNCIDALIIFIYELPLSLSKYLPGIVIRLAQIITSPRASARILIFLAIIAHNASLFGNFTDTDFKRVLGISLQYIKHKRSQNQKFEQQVSNHGHSLSRSRDQYVLILAYQVLIKWFVALRLNDRKKYIPWIVRGFVLAGNGCVLDEESQACFEVLAHYAFTDHSASSLTNAQMRNGLDTTKSWLVGSTIFTVQLDRMKREARIITRRSSGAAIYACRSIESEDTTNAYEALRMTNNAAQQSTISNCLCQTDQVLHFSPEHYLMQLLIHGDSETWTIKPIRLPLDDESIGRAIDTLDRIPIVDFHKIGVLYVADGQNSEEQVLSNVTGSNDYLKFLAGLGEIHSLKYNSKFYSGGLDTENDSDGKYAYFWRNKISQIVYHCCTMMPTDKDKDPSCIMKKRHVGNNFVNIVFNDSILPYCMETLKSEFNWVNIVISKHTREMDVPISDLKLSASDNYYLVQVLEKEHLPRIGMLGGGKLISLAALGSFVRELSLIYNQVAQVYLKGDEEYTTNWRERLRHINRLRKRAKQWRAPIAQEVESQTLSTTDELSGTMKESLEIELDFSRFT